MEKKNVISKIWASVKEAARKFMVTLKRNPHFIPFAMLLISFIVLSFNLTKISNTTATMNKSGMGLCAFIAMLFSLLSMVCMLNAFPKRAKPRIPVIALMLVLFGVIIAVDLIYSTKVINGITTDADAIAITQKNYFIVEAQNTMIIHVALMSLTAVCVVLEPVFAKLLRKINTSVDIENNGEIEAIEISDEE